MATEVEQHVSVENESGIGWIRFNRPEKMNAIGALTRKQLAESIKQAERDDAVRVVVLTGSGRAFSSGADVTEMVQGAGMRTPEDVGNVLRNEYMPMLMRLRTMPKPVMGAMTGPAVGIGASFALACDIRIGTPESYILEAFVNIGLAPDGGVSWLLPRLAGTGVAYEMFFTGKPLSAADAHRLGVINRIVPAERLEEEVRDLANQLVAQPRQALAGAKRSVNHALVSSYEDAMEFESYLQEAQAASSEFAEGVQAFLARRLAKKRTASPIPALPVGLPHKMGRSATDLPGQTVTRLCGSGMQATIAAAREIQSGAADIMVAGGVESMTRAPWVMPKPDGGFPRGSQTAYDTALGWRLVNPKMATMYGTLQMGETAERVAQKYEVSREEQDAFALRSHQRAVAARRSGRLAEEIVPVSIAQRKGEPLVVSDDEGPRPDSTLVSLAKLKPAFAENGSVTAGNASPLNDGATALVLMSNTKARERGLQPLARLVAAAPAGVHPDYMGIGPVPSSLKALEKAGLHPGDMAVVELNEAFASQSLACIRLLGLDEERVNVNGGAIALGHPLGSSGARLVGTLVREMEHRDAEYGLATMCIGVGQGIASIWQKI